MGKGRRYDQEYKDMIVELFKSGMTVTDLGSQYISNDMKILCEKLSIIQSFSKKGCPYDNACIESFHASLKKEEVYTKTYKDFNEAKLAIFTYIEGWYNRKRLHSAINYMTPAQCEALARNIA